MAPSGPSGSGKPGRLIVVCGPSGVGKSTLVGRLRREEPRIVFSVSATTRAPRPGERDGADYRFTTKEAFAEGIRRGDFLEHADVYGNFYGTPRRPIEEAVAEGRFPLLEIDMQGVRQIRSLGFPAFCVFIAPPDPASLEKRLTGRHTETPDQLARRLKHAMGEIAQSGLCDRTIVNDDVDRAYRELKETLETHVFSV